MLLLDIVETGATMKEKWSKKSAEDIMESSAHLIANKNSYYAKKDEILSLYEKINQVVKTVSNALDLYSRVEDLLGVNEVTPTLYKYYFSTLENLEFDSLLDIGCGRGAFLEQLKSKFP